ncbi:efflux RND transporter permease subunit [Lysobacter sp. K5869]|uniref:efflux RND transporter permease subunit n=1 Tax=Lysobacter sp. K5869 TaxID=2820808 RepID=UPI001C05F966|nr:efflux RND transporter permease subunit [Lysobacter sp. K5869]QWP75376.1 efflux RND transporter permease subunit [Lysobacter sp. K5869]
MNLFAPVIRRPIGASLMGLGLILAGLWSYLMLGVAALPSMDLPAVAVMAQMPGASAQTMGNTVLTPLERHLGRIPGVKQMVGIANENSAQVQILFEFGINADSAARDVQAAINASMSDLPAGMPAPPQYFKFDTAQLPVLLVTLTSSSMSSDQLYEVADSLAKPVVARVEGVATVQLSGGSPRAVRVELDDRALAAKGLTANEVRNALAAANVTSALGTISDGPQQLLLITNASLRTAPDFAGLVIAVRDRAPIRLSDVARVYEGQEDEYQGAWYNGERTVVMQISKRADANSVATVEAIRAALPGLRRIVPADVAIHPIFDLTQTTKAGLHEVEFTLLVSVAMVALVMLLFLRRVGPTLIAMASVPLSLAGAFIAMYFMDFSLNTLSLIALVLAIGFVVDDAIVVIENVVRHMELGQKPLEAALNGTREIGFTVVSITLSLVAVFAPMVFGNNIFVTLVREFSVTLVVAIVVSAVVSLTVTPALCGKYLRHDPTPAASDPGFFARLERRLHRLDDAVLERYRHMLTWSMRHRRLMRWQPISLIVLTGALAAAVAMTAGGGVMPEEDLGMMQAMVKTDANVSPERFAGRVRQVAATLQADPAVADVTTVLGGNGFGETGGATASLFVDLRPAQERRATVAEVIARLNEQYKNLSDVEVVMTSVQFFGGGGDTRSSGGQYQLQLTSSTGGNLQDTTLKLAQRMRALPQLRDVGTSFDGVGKQQAINVDRQAAARLGLSMADVDDALYNAFGQRPVSLIYSDINQYRVVLGSARARGSGPQQLLDTYVRSGTGTMVPLSAFATIAPSITPTSVMHYNQLESATVSYNVAQGVSQVEGIRVVDDLIARTPLPPGVQDAYSGNNQKLMEAVTGAAIMLIAVIVLMYVLLGMLYNSLFHPLVILSTLPAAGMGAFLAMLVTQTQLTMMSVIAVLMLIGIVKKNAIMMVDFALVAEREHGMDPVAAITEAALVRFRPITMTTLAAMGAALPLAIGFGVGSEMRQPLGIAILGGLIVSQLLTLLSTPAIYLWLHDRSQRKAQKRERRAQRAAAKDAGKGGAGRFAGLFARLRPQGRG